MRTISRILQIGRGWRTNSWNDVEETYRYWSEKVRYRLCQMRKDTNRIKPKA